MLQFIPVTEGNTIAIRASGKLTREDYQGFLPQLEAEIKRLGKVSVLFELDNFSGWTLDAAKDDFKFGLQYRDALERIAIVGDTSWERWMTLMMKPFIPSAKVAYFQRPGLQVAWDWLREGDKIRADEDKPCVYKHIVVPVDYSKASRLAAMRAIELARPTKAKITLLHIVHESPVTPYFFSESMVAVPYDYNLVRKLGDQQFAAAKQHMQGFVARLESDVDLEVEVLAGNIKTTLLSYIEARKPDLVVLGTGKIKGLKKHLGSSARYIQSHARCEVLLVPVPGSKAVSDANWLA